jgi:phage terminase small subunit
MKARKLTEKQKVFVAEYQKDLNGTQAAIRAGYSVKNADVISDQLLGKTWVLEEIKKQTEERLHTAEGFRPVIVVKTGK